MSIQNDQGRISKQHGVQEIRCRSVKHAQDRKRHLFAHQRQYGQHVYRMPYFKAKQDIINEVANSHYQH